MEAVGQNGRRFASTTISSTTYKYFKHALQVLQAEVEFVSAVSAGGSVKFVDSGVNFSIFTHFFVFFLLKLLKLGEIDGVKFLA